MASWRQLFDTPAPPLKFEFAGSQAMSPAAAMTGSPPDAARTAVWVATRGEMSVSPGRASVTDEATSPAEARTVARRPLTPDAC